MAPTWRSRRYGWRASSWPSAGAPLSWAHKLSLTICGPPSAADVDALVGELAEIEGMRQALNCRAP